MGIFSAIAGTAGSLLGGAGSIIGALSDQNTQENIATQNYNLQNEAFNRGIQVRVKDAKAAGIHPLYALGANTYQPGPIFSGQSSAGAQLSNAGQSLGSAATRLLDPYLRKEKELQLKLLSSQVGESDARKNYYDAIAAKERQAGLSSVGSNLGIMDEMSGGKPGLVGHVSIGELKEVNESEPAGQGIINLKPSEQKTSKHGDSGVMAGEAPGFQEFILPGGQPIQLPASEEGSLSEIMEAVPWYMWPGILQYNSRYYGDPWLNDFRDFSLFGKTSKNAYPRAKDRKKGHFYQKGGE